MKNYILLLMVLLPIVGFTQNQTDSTKAEAVNLKSDSNEFSPFRLWVGTNLDFLDGVEAGHLYANLDFTTPLGYIKGKKNSDETNQLLLNIGIFQNRSFSVDSSGLHRSASVDFLNFNTFPTNDSLDLLRSTYSSKPKQTVNNLGFYATFAVRLSSSGDKVKIADMDETMNNINMYIAVRSEIIRREYNTVYNYDLLDQDTLRVPAGSPIRRSILIPNRTVSRYTGIISIGAPLILISKTLEVRFNPYVGKSFAEEDFWVGSLGFNITEKELGLSIGGEARTLFKGEVPFMSVFIAKSFTIKDFKELIKFN